MAAATVENVPVTEKQTLLHVNTSNVTKLTESNYLMWSRQVQALLTGYDLGGYLDNSKPAPPATLTNNNTTSPNPAYAIWVRQDQLVYSALLGAISLSIQPILSATTTSEQIWTKLKATYAKPSRGHIKQIKEQMKAWKKGNRTVTEYVQGFTNRFDQLALLGKAVDHEDQVEKILEGLPEEYKQFVDQIESRDTAPTITELHEKLLNHELRFHSSTITATPATSVAPVTANAAAVHSSPRYNNNRNHNYNGGYNQNRNSRPNYDQNYRRDQSYQPRGYNGKCQLCSVFGHSARTCSQNQQNRGSHSSRSEATSSGWHPKANMASLPRNDSPWIVDSGATHHLTSDLYNLSLHNLYNGGEEVTIADGSRLAISHTGEGSQNGGPITPREN